MADKTGTTFGNAFLASLLRKWRFIAATAVLGAVFGAALCALRPLTYESTATVIIYPPLFRGREGNNTSGRLDELMPRSLPMEAYRSIALSRAMARQVIDMTGIDGLRPNDLQNMMTVDLVEHGTRSVQFGVQYTKVMHLTVRARRPESAALLAQTWAELLIENMNELGEKGLSETNKLLDEMHATAKEQLEESEAELAEHRRNWNLELVQAEKTALESLLTEYEKRLIKTQVDIARMETELDTLTVELAAEREKVELFKAPTDTALWLALMTRDLPGEALGPESGLRSEILNPIYTDLRGKVVAGRRDLEGLLSDRARLQEEITKLRSEIRELQATHADKQIERDERERNRNTLESSYQIVRRSFELGRLAAVSSSSDVVIAAEAVVPEVSVSVPPLILVPLVAFVAALLAMGLILAQTYYDVSLAPAEEAG